MLLALAVAALWLGWWEAMRQRTRVNRAILERFREAELQLAFPTRTLHVETPPGDGGASGEPGRGSRSDRSDDAA